jgi:hypothetical protein
LFGVGDAIYYLSMFYKYGGNTVIVYIYIFHVLFLIILSNVKSVIVSESDNRRASAEYVKGKILNIKSYVFYSLRAKIIIYNIERPNIWFLEPN